MRVDSAGIYNSRGLVQNRPNNVNPQKSGGVAKTSKPTTTEKTQKFVMPKLAESLNQLSSAELNQINKLFGQVDLSSLSGTDNSTVEDRPGRLVDIVV